MFNVKVIKENVLLNNINKTINVRMRVAIYYYVLTDSEQQIIGGVLINDKSKNVVK